MSGITEIARRLRECGLVVFHASVKVGVKSVFDVTGVSGEVFVSVECHGGFLRTEKGMMDEGRAEFGETVVLDTVLGREVGEGDEKDGDGDGDVSFQECWVRLTVREEDGRILDYGNVNIAEFVEGGDTRVMMKLGGFIDIFIECHAWKWGMEDDKNDEISMDRPVITKKYGMLYKTRYEDGEWSEYPVLTTVMMNGKRRMELWSIEGPEEDDGNETCSKAVCRVGEIAGYGRMSRLQKLRGWANVHLFNDRLEKEGFGKRVSDCSVDCEDGSEEV